MPQFDIGDEIPGDFPHDQAVADDLSNRHLTVIFGQVVSMHDFDADPNNIPAKPKASRCLRCC